MIKGEKSFSHRNIQKEELQVKKEKWKEICQGI